MVNLVILSDGQKYMDDVEFGAGPIQTLLLVAGDIWIGIGHWADASDIREYCSEYRPGAVTVDLLVA